MTIGFTGDMPTSSFKTVSIVGLFEALPLHILPSEALMVTQEIYAYELEL